MVASCDRPGNPVRALSRVKFDWDWILARKQLMALNRLRRAKVERNTPGLALNAHRASSLKKGIKHPSSSGKSTDFWIFLWKPWRRSRDFAFRSDQRWKEAPFLDGLSKSIFRGKRAKVKRNTPRAGIEHFQLNITLLLSTVEALRAVLLVEINPPDSRPYRDLARENPLRVIFTLALHNFMGLGKGFHSSGFLPLVNRW